MGTIVRRVCDSCRHEFDGAVRRGGTVRIHFDGVPCGTVGEDCERGHVCVDLRVTTRRTDNDLCDHCFQNLARTGCGLFYDILTPPELGEAAH